MFRVYGLRIPAKVPPLAPAPLVSPRRRLGWEPAGARLPVHILQDADGQPQRNRQQCMKEGQEEGEQSLVGDRHLRGPTGAAKGDSEFPAWPPSLLDISNRGFHLIPEEDGDSTHQMVLGPTALSHQDRARTQRQAGREGWGQGWDRRSYVSGTEAGVQWAGQPHSPAQRKPLCATTWQ